MRDPITGIGQEFEGVVSADHQVAHIEGPADLAALEHVLHVARSLDHRAEMGVDRLQHAMGGDDLLDLVEHRRSVIPGRRIDLHAGGPVEAGDHRRDEQVTAGSTHQRCGPFGSSKAGVTLSGVVEHDGNEAADHLEVVAGAHLAQFTGVGREIAVGSEFGGGKPEILHLGKHTVDRKFQPPAGDFADTPTDGCSGNALEETAQTRPRGNAQL